MHRRRFLAAAGLAAVAGCTAGPPADDGATDRPTGSETTGSPGSTTATGSPGDPASPDPSSPESSPESTADPPSHEESMAEQDPDLAVRVVNDHDVTHTVSVTVTRESGAVVHDATHEVAPGEDREVYNLRAADPEGVEAFTVAASLDGATGSVGVETSACYGPVVVQVTGEGGLYPYYAVC